MSTHLPENRLLAALPEADRTRLITRTTEVTLGHKDGVYRSGKPIDHVYFPRSGMLSVVVVLEGGQTIEVGAFGVNGMAGATVALGATTSDEDVFCQIPTCVCRRLTVGEFATELARGGPLRDIVYAYLRATLRVAGRQTACGAVHPNDERLAQWLLRCRDAAGADQFDLTHEFMAAMLGVRRATVSVMASTLQSAGLITYHRGRVTILDPDGLEQAACECYPIIRDAIRRPA